MGFEADETDKLRQLDANLRDSAEKKADLARQFKELSREHGTIEEIVTQAGIPAAMRVGSQEQFGLPYPLEKRVKILAERYAAQQHRAAEAEMVTAGLQEQLERMTQERNDLRRLTLEEGTN